MKIPDTVQLKYMFIVFFFLYLILSLLLKAQPKINSQNFSTNFEP